MIEIINPEYGDYRKKFDLTILDKLTISYSGEIYNQTKRIMCDYYHASDIKDGCVSFIRINTKDYISGSVVNVINNLRSSIGDNVTIVIDTSIKNRTDIELLRTLFKNNIFVINTYESFTTILNYIDDKGIDYINPLENTTTMKQYEEYYLPMKLICTTLPIKQYDFTIFKYVKDITFGEHTIGYPTSIQLPTSVEYVNFKYQHNFDQSNWKITNWKELHNIKQIEDYGNLDIPYPQIQYEHNNKTPKSRHIIEIIFGLYSFFCCLYLLIPFITMLYSIIFHPFNFVYLSNNITNHLVSSFDFFLTISFSIIELVYSISLHYYTSIYWISIIAITSIPTTFLFHYLAFVELVDLTLHSIKKFIRIKSKGFILFYYVESFIIYIHRSVDTLGDGIFFLQIVEIMIGISTHSFNNIKVEFSATKRNS
ncbi:hypothetical protein QTN25_006324 [Entamoeba marina]